MVASGRTAATHTELHDVVVAVLVERAHHADARIAALAVEPHHLVLRSTTSGYSKWQRVAAPPQPHTELNDVVVAVLVECAHHADARVAALAVEPHHLVLQSTTSGYSKW